MDRQILKETLTAWGMRVVEAESAEAGLEALEKARAQQEPFSFLLVDAQMPNVDGFTLVQWIRERQSFAGTTIMMLSSAGRPGERERCRQLGMNAYLTKPVKQSDLLSILSFAAGALTKSLATLEKPRARRILDVDGNQLRILLAEDNLTNQVVASQLLRNWDCAVTTVRNGRAALEAWSQQAFDVVLMDVQMPEMDGLSATRAIRDREKATGERTPIIAMTAHVLKGDRERCLEAGMDGYISKPIRAEKLLQSIQTMAGKKLRATAQTSKPPRPKAGPGVNEPSLAIHSHAHARLDPEVAQAFLEEGPQLLEQAQRALDEGNASALAGAAHALRGAAAQIGAPAVVDAAAVVETMARNGDLRQSSQVLERLRLEMDLTIANLLSLETTASSQGD